MADNHVVQVGNLTRDPELRFTQGGMGVCSLGMAVNRRFQQNGEWVEKVSFFNVTVWGELGENVAASCTKGMRVVVTGRLEQREYETNDGQKRSVVEIVADEVAPSLRWARAEVTRTQRPNQGGDSQPRYGTTSNQDQEPRGGVGSGRAADPIYGDEEPF